MARKFEDAQEMLARFSDGKIARSCLGRFGRYTGIT